MSRRRQQHEVVQPDWVNDYIDTAYIEDDLTSEHTLMYDPRDGSKGLHAYREEGRYGSYPIHDDYEDESFPD